MRGKNANGPRSESEFGALPKVIRLASDKKATAGRALGTWTEMNTKRDHQLLSERYIILTPASKRDIHYFVPDLP